MKDYCVYTVLLGNYELLQEQPVRADSCIDFICFTDNKELRSQTWQIKHIAPIFPSDIARSSRFPKICPHHFLQDYAASLYIDNSITLFKRPEKIFEELLTDADKFSCFKHSFRERLCDEFKEVVDLGFDDANILMEQYNAYHSLYPEILLSDVFWGGFLLRKHNDYKMIEAMEDWWSQVCRYSRRDQLSLPYVINKYNLRVHIIPGDISENRYNKWPTAVRFGNQIYNKPSFDDASMDSALVFGNENVVDSEALANEEKYLSVLKELDEIKSSRFWKLMSSLNQLKDKLIPNPGNCETH